MFRRIRTAFRFHISEVVKKIQGELSWAEKEFSNGRIDANTYYDGLTKAIIMRSLRPHTLGVDVGCYQGEILAMMMACVPAGEFLAFEPLPHLYADLVRRFPQKNVHFYNLALSNRKGVTTFNYVLTNPAYSGLKRRRYDRPQEQDTQITVNTDLLDHILLQYPSKRVDFIKIDVEGAEYLVLQGAEALIRRDRPQIVFECGQAGAEAYGSTPEQVYTFLCEQCQMHISLLHAWLLKKPPLSRAQFCDQYYTGKHFYFLAHP